MKICKKAYGKINLTLEVGPLRTDGFHDIRSIMQNIELHDTLIFEDRDDQKIVLTGNRDDLSYGSDNLIIKAANLLKDAAGVQKGVQIFLDKKIPIAAGLGGGSSDAAATLLALNSLWGIDWPIGKLVLLGSQIGSDVPFCIIGGTCVVEGRGEKVRPINSIPKTEILVVKPDFGVSTKKVYEKFDEIPKKPETINVTKMMEKAILESKTYKVYLSNDLECVTKGLYPEVNQWFELFNQKNSYALLSGSGPTILGFIENGFINKLYDEIKNQTKFICITNTL